VLELRTEIDELISRGAVETAYVRLAELWRTQGGFSSAAFVLSRAPRLIDKLAVTSYRLAILRSFTVEPAVPLLRAAAFLSGINLKIHVGAFNAYANEILDPESSLTALRPMPPSLQCRHRMTLPYCGSNMLSLRQKTLGQ
jgi:hypothetical protein